MMQQAVLIKKPCQRAHQRGQEEVISMCLNKDCQYRLSCLNCQRDGYHSDHINELCHFDFLPIQLEKGFTAYKNARIQDLINQKKKEFEEAQAKAEVLKVLDLQEANFLNLIKKISGYDLFVRETIKMVEAKDFLLLTEAQAQTLVDLKNNLQVENLMKFIAAPITPERSNYNFQQLSQQKSVKIDQFLSKHCQDALQLGNFFNKHLLYQQMIPLEIQLIIENKIKELNEENSFYLGEFEGKLKQGRGILVRSDCQEIFEGVWEKNCLKWGSKIGKCLQNINYIYIGSFTNDKKEGKGIYKYSNGASYEGEYKNNNMEGKGIYKYSNGESYEGEWKNGNKEGKGIYKCSNGDSYEGEWKNDKREGKGIYKYSNGESSEGPYQNGVTVCEHQVYKPNSKQPYKITFYGANGQVKEVKMLV